MDMKIEKTGFYGKKKDDKNGLLKSSFLEKISVDKIYPVKYFHIPTLPSMNN